MKISVVTPIYKSELIIPELVKRLTDVLSANFPDYEIILVNDGSPDNSWNIIQSLAKENNRIIGIQLSRNFGQHHAITAGLSKSTGDWIVVMDCDLQDRPEEIINLYKKSQEGYELVVAKKIKRQDNFIRKIESNLFYYVLNKLTGIKVSSGIGNFGIYHQKVIDHYLNLKEEYRSFGMMIIWMGFKRFELEVQSDERFSGKSSYTLIKKMKLALTTITSFSDRVLIFMIFSGLFITMLSILILILHIISVWLNSQPLEGWTSLIISIYMSLGIIVSSLGVLGLYIGKIFSQVKNRPIFIISSTTKNEEN
jgi:glycosyltransferase involved in cell wall biosynthesis